ncbi:hypothetical protein OG824_13675 [Streptomyces prunicolor]|uniref:hypothetical protein n=1 Tax=Streptomyces prunicolor TaxID=67348 RepID=UPI0022585627|nr:hypothetical protein [Streptomyces prunicolor]MCX5236250.1 hypothetical protein [Streptomyces prunicolor]
MPASKIVDEHEVIRWFEEGRTYQWMVEEYQRKYGIDTKPSMWGNFRRRRGLEARISRDAELVPWDINAEHRWKYPVSMLRLEARLRGGFTISDEEQGRLDSWKQMMSEEDAVVHYDPDTEEGFHYVRRQEGDNDLIHQPEQSAKRGRARKENE